MKKTKAITIHLTEDIAEMVLYCAEQERRKPAELVGLWVEDVAIVETRKKSDKGTTYKRPKYWGD